MRLATLFSGGKDSVLATYIMEGQGHEVVTLVNVRPRDPHSWVFHTSQPGHPPLMAEAMCRGWLQWTAPAPRRTT